MTEQQKKIFAGGAFAVMAAGVLYFELSGSGGAPAPSQAPVITTAGGPAAASGEGRSGGGSAKNAPRNVAELDPTLRMGPMLVTESLVYSGTGRNIFSTASAPIAIPTPVASARPEPAPPTVITPVGPPPLPPIDLKFFGTATTASGSRQAFLLRGDDVFLASAGDVVQRRYKVVSIAANSILVEDLVNSNRQTLPLLVN